MARVTVRINLGPGASLGAVAGVVDDLLVIHDLGLRVDIIGARRDAEETIEGWWRDSPGQLAERSLNLDESTSSRLQRLLDQRRQEDEVAEHLAGAPPEMWFDEWYHMQRRYFGKGSRRRFLPPPFWPAASEVSLAEVAPDLFARLVAEEFGRYVQQVPTVERLSYQNPIELVLIGVGSLVTAAGFKFGTFTEMAKLIRDWSADKQERQDQARQTRANADRAELGSLRERAEIERTDAETREINARASKAEAEAEVLRRYARQGGRVEDLIEAGLAPRELQAMAELTAGTVEVEVDENGP